MKVLICDPISPSAVQRMRERGIEVTVRRHDHPGRLLEVIPAYHAVVVRSRTKIRKNVSTLRPNLKVIVRGGVGVDNIDHGICRRPRESRC